MSPMRMNAVEVFERNIQCTEERIRIVNRMDSDFSIMHKGRSFKVLKFRKENALQRVLSHRRYR